MAIRIYENSSTNDWDMKRSTEKHLISTTKGGATTLCYISGSALIFTHK